MLMADRITADTTAARYVGHGEWEAIGEHVEAEPVTVDVADGAVTFTLDDGERLVFGLDRLRQALGYEAARDWLARDRRAATSGPHGTPEPPWPARILDAPRPPLALFKRLARALNPERDPHIGCLSNDEIDRMEQHR